MPIKVQTTCRAAWLRPVLAGVLAATCLSTVAVCADADLSLPPNFPATWLRSNQFFHFRVALSGGHFVNRTVGGSMELGTGWVYYEGVFQPNTCYVRALTNGLEGRMRLVGPVLQEGVVGQSHDFNWYVAPEMACGITVSSRLQPNSPAFGDYPRGVMQQTLRLLTNVFELGFRDVFTDSFKWSSPDTFEAPGYASSGRKFLARGSIKQRDATGRPLLVDYATPGLPTPGATIRYVYQDDGLRPAVVPREIDVEVKTKNGGVHFAYRIEELRVSTNDAPQGGYHWAPFTNYCSLRNFTIYTNDAIYGVVNGRLQLVVVPESSPLGNSRGARWIIIGGLLLVVNIPFVAWLFKHGRATSPPAA